MGSQLEKRHKTKIDINIHKSRVTGMPIFSKKCQKSQLQLTHG